jgi:hypothetical protein
MSVNAICIASFLNRQLLNGRIDQAKRPALPALPASKAILGSNMGKKQFW